MTEYIQGIEVTSEMTSAIDMARRFSYEVLRPVGIQLDRMSAVEVTNPNSNLFVVLDRFAKLGFGDLESENTYPGLSSPQRALLHSMIWEELCAGDVGLGITCGLLNRAPTICALFGNDAAEEFFSVRNELCCLAITEPNNGTNVVAFNDSEFRSGSVTPQLKYTKQGDSYVLNGQKSAWVSTGTIAGAGIVFATNADSEAGLAHGAVFVMPLDLEGVSRGKPLEKLGQRSLNQGEIYFDNVVVDQMFLMAEGPDMYPLVIEETLKDANLFMGMMFVGVARAAYELALGYSKERIQGGRPIFEHQNVKLQLFDMFSRVEASRALARTLLINNCEANHRVDYQYGVLSKVYCTEACYKVTDTALRLFGANGLSREYPIEKLYRDARASLVEDGENRAIAINAAFRL